MQKFALGQVMVTRGVYDLMMASMAFAAFVNISLDRYSSGDWGILTDEDKHQNEVALFTGERLMGSYELKGEDGWKIWIITEWDRSLTTILFPDEY